MATYNGARFLPEQLDSILAQSVGHGLEFEVIVADDGSTDETLAVLSEYSASNSQVKVLPGETNQGVAPTFERALAACTGEFVLLADQDDVWPRGRVNALVGLLRSGADLVYGDVETTDVDLNPIARVNAGPPGRDLCYKNRIPGMSMAFRSSLLDTVLPIEGYIHDWWILLIALELGEVQRIPQVVTLYRQHGANTIGTRSRRRGGEEFRQGLRDRERFYSNLAARLDGRSDPARLQVYWHMARFYRHLASGEFSRVIRAGADHRVMSEAIPRRVWLATLRHSLSAALRIRR